MIDEILTNLFRIKVPLLKNPLETLNSYVIKGLERSLVIDTGWNREECMSAMQNGLRELEIDIGKTDFFVTHLHPDHMGLVSKLARETSKVYFGRADVDWIKSDIYLDQFIGFARLNGFPENELQAASHKHPGFKVKGSKLISREQVSFHILKDGDPVHISDYLFECIKTPGHTKDHMCLYEPHKKILVTGDHILKDFTPTVQLWTDERNPLKEYLASLDKIYELDIELVLPGHTDIFKDCKKGIRELKHHYRKKFEEVISILKAGSKNAFQVASQMSRDAIYDSWDSFSGSQKWLATGEAIAYLKYLEEEGTIRKEMLENEIVFSLELDYEK